MMEQAHTLVVFSLPSTCQKQTTLRSHNDQCGFHLMFFCLLACFFVFCSSDRPVQACQSIVDMYTEKVPENIHTGITVHPWLFWNRLCRRTGFKGTVNVWLKDLSESGTNSGQSIKTVFLCIALSVLELTLQTRLASNSEIHLLLPPECVHHHHPPSFCS